MDEEIAFHLEARIERLIAGGWPPETARDEALRRFGPLEDTMQRLRADALNREERLHMKELIGDVWQDIRYGARLLARYPGFGAGAIVTLTLGIGCTSSMFAVVKHSLLDPLPYVAQDRLVYMAEAFKVDMGMLVSYPNFVDWRARARSFDAIESVMGPFTQPVLAGSEPASANVQGVSRGLFAMLGVRPVIGRWISADDNRPGGPLVVMIGEDFWRKHFGATPDLASIHLTVFGNPAPVMGVMPADFSILGTADVWYPEEISPVLIRGAGNYMVIGRLRRGVSLGSAGTEMNGIAAQLKATYGDESMSSAVVATPLRNIVVGSARRTLLILLGAALFVLVVTCANVAMMLLARASARSREMSVRVALGSSRLRLARQAVAESSVLAFCGVGGGLLVAWASVVAIRSYGRGQLPRLSDLRVNLSVTLFAVAVAVGSLALFSVIPLVANRRLSGRSVGALAAGGSRPSRSWAVLVVIQGAATVILVLGASLIVRTVSNILGADIGYDPRHVTVSHIPLASRYESEQQLDVAMYRLEQGLREIAPTGIVGLASALPSERGGGHGPLLLPPIHDPLSQSEWAAIGDMRVVTPGYFAALRIPLLRGRMLSANDRENTPDVALVNAALAAKLWPGEDPIGKQVRALVDKRNALFTVVGMVGNARDWRHGPTEQIEMYVPIWQRPTTSVVAVIRSDASPAILDRAIRTLAHAVDPATPVRTDALTTLLKGEIADRRFIAGILLAFAVSVLVLTIVGIFGAVAYAVSRGTREIGIRIAIGASPIGIWLGVQQRVMAVMACGAALGVAVSWSLGRVMSGLLYGLSPHDLPSFVAAALSVIAAGVLAAAWPARRAASVDPSVALRAE
jgi:putative ABC transport system permease protein